MPKSSQSNPGQISLEAVVFIDGFCRRNLSLPETKLIGEIFDVALDGSLSALDRRDTIRRYLSEIPKVVTRSAQSLNIHGLEGWGDEVAVRDDRGPGQAGSRKSKANGQ